GQLDARAGAAKWALRTGDDVHRWRPGHRRGVRAGRLIMTGVKQALDAARTYQAAAQAALAKRLATKHIDADQRAAHGFAWIATSVAALEALLEWAEAGKGANPVDAMIVRLALAETIGQLAGGLPMGQNELLRPADLGIGAAGRALADACTALLDEDLSETRQELVAALSQGRWPSETLHDADLDSIRDQYRRFTDSRIIPNAHKWHLANELVPDEIVRAMADLGTFGVCIPEEFGGLGLNKLVMCIVTEELSRGWIGTGSLVTRSEIAGELIVHGGTDEQKSHWLPKIASGEVLPTAVFTEPDTGSDLGS